MTQEENAERYKAAAHAMQSGVAFKMQREPNGDTTPKHLRVGVNSAMVDTSTIVKLLVDKGVITMDEWFKALADGMEAEVKLYESELGVKLG